MSNGIVGLVRDCQFERGGSFFEIAALEHRYAISNIVALEELFLVQRAFHRQCFLQKSSGRIRHSPEVTQRAIGIYWSLKDFDDSAVAL